MLEDMIKFNKITKDCIFMSYKYYLDSFNEITLDFGIHKGSRNQYKKYKYWGLEISLDDRRKAPPKGGLLYHCMI